MESTVETQGIRYHFIETKKFKTIHFVAKFKAPLQRDTITKRALIPYVLKEGTKSYPKRQLLRRKLDDLYGGMFFADGSKKGENHIITIRLELANPKFLPDNTAILEEGIALFKELLFHPIADGKAFIPAIIEREKQTLKQKIQSLADDKMQYANLRLIEEMCKGEPYSIRVHGYEEDLNEVDHKGLYEYYQNMIKEDELDVYVVGDFNRREMEQTLSKYLQRDVHPMKKISLSGEKRISKQKEVIERQAVQQAKLHIGYRTNITFKDEEYPALHVFNGLFGGFPSSKLFMNVREKHSLAYYASSRMESHKGLLFVFSGIAPENYTKTKNIIREQFEAMKAGEFTEQALCEVKDLISNQLLETMDHPQGMVELLYQQVLADTEQDPKELIAKIKAVTKKDVIDAAKKIEEDTVYLLTEEGGNASA